MFPAVHLPVNFMHIGCFALEQFAEQPAIEARLALGDRVGALAALHSSLDSARERRAQGEVAEGLAM